MQWLITAGLIGGPAMMAATETAKQVIPQSGNTSLVYIAFTMLASAVAALWLKDAKDQQQLTKMIVGQALANQAVAESNVVLAKAMDELRQHCKAHTRD